MSRDLTRTDLRKIVQIGLENTNGNYRLLVQLFNMPTRGLQAVPELPAQARLPPAVPALPRGPGQAPGSRARQSRGRRPQRLGSRVVFCVRSRLTGERTLVLPGTSNQALGF